MFFIREMENRFHSVKDAAFHSVHPDITWVLIKGEKCEKRISESLTEVVINHSQISNYRYVMLHARSSPNYFVLKIPSNFVFMFFYEGISLFHRGGV